MKRILSLLLCVLLLLGGSSALTACGQSEDGPAESRGAASDEETDAEPDPFEGVNYDGRPFRVYTSTNVASIGMGNSNALIQGGEKTDGNPVNDAVIERNMIAEDKLGIKLEFTPLDVNYDGVYAAIRKLTTSGTDEYDLVINDIYPFANLSLEGTFRNVLSEECRFDFDKDYWYRDFMDDLRLMDGYEYMLAGDYFIDILRSAHILLFNKDMYSEYTHRSADEVYGWVENYEWTYEKMNEMITGYYVDLNQNNKKDHGDRYGMSILQYWGSSIGFVVSADPHFITRDDSGIPSVTLGEGERAEKLVEVLRMVLDNDSACIGLTTDAEILGDFTEGLSLIGEYQRLGSLENPILRDMKQEMGVLPYPMLYATDRKYTTAAHDTTELGAILSTSSDLDFISTCVEVLNRETGRHLMPRYYKEALQIQYVNDPYASEMIGIIHDNFGDAFVVAYNYCTGSRLIQVFSEAADSKRTFAVTYKSSEKSVKKALEKSISTFRKKNGIA